MDASASSSSMVAVFVLPPDQGHFNYTRALAKKIHTELSLSIEYWSWAAAESRAPKEFASFHCIQPEIDFPKVLTDNYVEAVSYGSSDAEGQARLAELSGNGVPSEEVIRLVSPDPIVCERLLRDDVKLVVTCNVHITSWVTKFCVRNSIPCLGLLPSPVALCRDPNWLHENAKKIEREEDLKASNAATPHSFASQVLVFHPALLPDQIVNAVHDWRGYLDSQPTSAKEPTERSLEAPEHLRSSDELPSLRMFVTPFDTRAGVASAGHTPELSSLLQWIEADDDTLSPIIYLGFGSMVRKTTKNEMYMKTILQMWAKGGGDQSLFGAKLLVSVAPELYTEVLAPLLGQTPTAAADGPVLYEDQRMRIQSWVPQVELFDWYRTECQQSVVAARKLVFLSHCGANSVHESLRSGVPIIGFPFFDDQYYNAQNLVEKGLSPGYFVERQVVDDKDQFEAELFRYIRKVATEKAVVGEDVEGAACLKNCESMGREICSSDGLSQLVAEASRLMGGASTK